MTQVEENKTPFTLEFECPGLPKRPNQMLRRGAMRIKQGERARWLRVIGLKTAGKRPLAPLTRAKVIATRFSSSCPDYDGLVGSFKLVIDALTELRIILDDSMPIIGIPEFKWEKSGRSEGKIRIRIEEIV